MATGKINSISSISGTITRNNSISGQTSSSGGGTVDHSKLSNRDLDNQHPVSAITNLQELLDEKLDSTTALPLIEEALQTKAKGLFYDLNKELSTKSYWYLTSEIDPITKQGTKASVISGPYDLGASGGGGGGVTEVTLTNIDSSTGESMWPGAVSVGASCNLKVRWSSMRESVSTGSGTIYCYVNNTLISKKTVAQGIVSFDVTDYIVSGDNKIEVKVVDAYSTTKNLIGTVTGVLLKLESHFNSNQEFSGNILYTYIPTGSIKKTVHFIVDGVELGTQEVTTSGETQAYTIPTQSHGAHSLKVYFNALVDGQDVYSNTLTYDLICFKPGDTTPIIASTFDDSIEQEQYIPINIYYRVYSPGKNTSDIKLIVNGEIITELVVDKTLQTWNYRPLEAGIYSMVIQADNAKREFSVLVNESSIDVQPITANLALSLNAVGRSNSEAIEKRSAWEDRDNDIKCELKGFNFVSDGWLNDGNGSTVLRLSGKARVVIPYRPFSSDIFNLGKTIEFEIKTSDVKDYEYQIIRCLAGGDSLVKSVTLTGEDTRTKKFIIDSVDIDKFAAKVLYEHNTYIFIYDETLGWTLDGAAVDIISDNNDFGIKLANLDLDPSDPDPLYYKAGDKITIVYAIIGKGFYVTPQIAKMQSQQTSLSTQYKEDDKVRLTFVINKSTEGGGNLRLVLMYINGIMSGVSKYPAGDTFDQQEYISIGAIENNDGTVTSSDATVDIYSIRVYDNNLTRKQVVNNWIADMQDPIVKAETYHNNDNYDENGDVVIDEQTQTVKGLSTTPYMILTAEALPAAKKDKKKVDVTFVCPADDSRNYTSPQAEADVQGTSSQYYYKKNFKIKYKINGDNGGFYDKDGNVDEKYKIRPPLSKKEKTFTYKNDVASSEGANNVELVRYFEDTKNWLSPAQQYQDPEDTIDGYVTKDRIRVGIDGFPIVTFHQTDASTKPKFYGKMNFNNDKGNDSTYGFNNGGDSNGDECWEFLQNNTELVLFHSSDMSNWAESFEARFPEESLVDPDQAYGTGAGELTKLTKVVQWVASTYRAPTDSESEKTRKLNKFKAEFETYFDKTSSLFYYLYTELFLMVDSRAKNAMLTWMGKRTYTDSSGTHTTDGDKWYWFPYDMDTALGINNEGLLVFDYDTEDTDIVNGGYVYNGQTSAFWCNVRDAFKSELQSMYTQLRAGNATNQKVAWDFSKIEQYYSDHQKVWSANIFNEDSYVKYLEPLELNADASYLGMLQGSKEEQRRWWTYNRFRYLDSKYLTGDASKQNIMLRAYKRSTFNITPYINCYVTAVFDQAKDGLTVTKDSQRNVEVTIEPPTIWDPKDTDSVVVLYSADLLKDVGDISGFQPGYANFSAATKLQRLKIGDASTTFTNSHLTGLVVGNNHLLTYLDARNCSALGKDGEAGYVTKTIELDNCTSIEEVYFDGTQILGASFPVGGNLRVVHLPGTITDLTIRNHPHLEELKLEGTDSLESVWLEDIPSKTVSVVEIVMGNSLKKARLIGIDETFTDTNEKQAYEQINDFYTKLETLEGKDAFGKACKIQEAVTGTIRLQTIAYKTWVELTARFPLIKIEADQVICVVTFYADDELTVLATQNVIQGETANNPLRLDAKPSDWNIAADWDWDDAYIYDEETNQFINSPHTHYNNYYYLDSETQTYKRVSLGTDFIAKKFYYTPNKATSKSLYYNFINWDTSFVDVQTDLNIKPLYEVYDRHFVVTSNTDTLIITAVPRKEEVVYGQHAHRSALENIPEKVYLDKWIKADGNEFIYETAEVGSASIEPITNNLTITAKWTDEGRPTLTLTKLAFNKFKYKAIDNIGISAWAVTMSSEQPEVWNTLDTPITPFEGEYIINAANTYYFWVKDNNNNIAFEYINAYKLNKVVSSGFTSVDIFEGTQKLTDFALSGTLITISYTLDFHYEKANILINSDSYILGTEIEVEETLQIKAECSPRDYTINFNTLNKGSTPISQTKTYLTKVEFPGEQYYKGFVIEGWYLEYDNSKSADEQFSSKWDFDINIIDETVITSAEQTSFTLYAKWTAYSMPTKIFISVPETSLDERYSDKQVEVWFMQLHAKAVKVNWGDGSEIETTDTINQFERIKHTYLEAGEYIIELTDTDNGTSIYGNSYTYQAVSPSKYITNVQFSWDVSKVYSYAFARSSITKLTFTPYITEIASSAFESCSDLTEIIMPTNIVDIGDQAFAGCSKLSGDLVFPKTLSRLGNYVFQSTSATSADFSACEKLTKIGIADFIYCNFLKKIAFPPNLMQISQDAFEVTALEEVILPETLQLLGTWNGSELSGYAFAGCSNLKHVVISSKLSQIGPMTFSNCPLLTSAGPLGGDYAIEFTWDTEIPNFAFRGASGVGLSLEKVTLPNTITMIGKEAFAYAGLREINLPVALTSIGSQAFSDNEKLRSINIPSNVTYIGYAAFAYTGLTDIQINTSFVDGEKTVEGEAFTSKPWFWQCPKGSPATIIHIPSCLTGQTPDETIAKVRAAYGYYWNYRNETEVFGFEGDL